MSVQSAPIRLPIAIAGFSTRSASSDPSNGIKIRLKAGFGLWPLRVFPGCTSKIGASPSSMSFSATLPKQKRLSGPRPWVAMTIRSGSRVSTRSRMASSIRPSTKADVTGIEAVVCKRFTVVSKYACSLARNLASSVGS